MFYGTSGSMYEEIEKAREAKKRHKQVIIRRIIAIIILVLVIAYLIIFIIDLNRFKNRETPLITISSNVKEYDDGIVTTHKSIGWLFRYYERETITDNEMAPIWRKIRYDDKLKRVNDPNLPEPEKDYIIPSNTMKQEKIENVLFFYDNDGNPLGTYACLLSERDCEISYSDTLEDDIKYQTDTKMGIIDNRYVFISEYKSKNTDAEEKHVYLYDITAGNYIAEYEGVRYTYIGNDDKGYIDSSKYIVRKNKYWGIDQVIKGLVSNYLEYKYAYISYSKDTNLYIFKTLNNTWQTYNANNKEYTAEINYKIDNIYIVNDSVYIVTYEQDYNQKKNYKLFNKDGENVLNKYNIDDLRAYDKFLTYTVDDKLYVIDYDGNPVIDAKEIFIDKYRETYKIKQYTIKISGDTLVITIPKDTTSTHFVNEYHYDMNTWELLKERIDVQETISY